MIGIIRNHKRVLKYMLAILICFVVVSLFVLKLVNKNNETDIEFVIGVSHPNLTDEWQIVANEEMKKAAAEHENVRLIFTNAGSSSFKQIRDIEKLISYGVDLLIVTVNDANVLGPKLNQVNKEIPVIVLGKDVGFYDYTLFIGPDYYSIGEQAAKQIKADFGEKTIQVVTINGPIEELSVIQMQKGFIEEVNKYPNVIIKESIYNNWSRTETENSVRELLEKTADFDVVFAQSNSMAIGANKALEERALDIPCIGVSEFLSQKYLTYLDIGVLDTIFFAPVGGGEAIENAMKILAGGEAVPKKIIMKSHPINQSNAEKYKQYVMEGGQAEKQQDFSEGQLNSDLPSIKVGYIQTGLWQDDKIFDIQEKLSKELDLEIIYNELSKELSDFNQDEKQKELFDDYLSQGVDIILFSPINNMGWDSLIDKAEKKGVDVVLLGSDLDLQNDNLIYIGPDYQEQGELSAKYLLENIYDGINRINVIEITDQSDHLSTINRSMGFRQILNGYSRITILKSFDADGNNLTVQYKIVEEMKKYPGDIQVIYSHNEEYMEGIINSLNEMKLSADKDVVIITNHQNDTLSDAKDIGCQIKPITIYGSQIEYLFEELKDEEIMFEKIILKNEMVEK